MDIRKRGFSPSEDISYEPPPTRLKLESQLTHQLQSFVNHAAIVSEEDSGMVGNGDPTPTKSVKARSLSDSTPVLSPSPNIRESPKSKDDHSIPSTLPRTPGRHRSLGRGLSLQMPPTELINRGSANDRLQTPVSPSAVQDTYQSPATVLPRHSRGLDFSRACTNLHHSTLADHSSPDSSPTIVNKGLTIPSRRSTTSMTLDSPQLPSASAWSVSSGVDRTAMSSSVGSASVLPSGGSSDSSSEDEPMEADEGMDIMNTPQAAKMSNPSAITPFRFGAGKDNISSPSAGPTGWSGNFFPAQASLMNYQKARLKRTGRSRKSSSSASGQSSVASPNTASPRPMRAMEEGDGGYFAREFAARTAKSRRESLSVGTSDLHISSGNDSGDEANMPAPSTLGVVRRPVTRRGNMLPKTKGFARIRAQLMEESTPIDMEARREADTIRQLRESDPDDEHKAPFPPIADSTEVESPLSNGRSPGRGTMRIDIPNRDSEPGFISTLIRHSSHPATQTPPPLDIRRTSSLSDEVHMESPGHPGFPQGFFSSSSGATQSNTEADSGGARSSTHGSRASTPQPSAGPLPSTFDIAKRVGGKRRRDDDFDNGMWKRRAVSPGLSAQNSPVVSQSPGQRDAWWGLPLGPRALSREGSVGSTIINGTSGLESGEKSRRSNSVSSMATTQSERMQTPSLGTNGPGPRRVGMQGMNDTNEKLTAMSID